MTLVPNETEQALNQQYDVYAAAREEYRKTIAEQADEIERLRAALREYVCDCLNNSCAYFPCGKIARAALDREVIDPTS